MISLAVKLYSAAVEDKKATGFKQLSPPRRVTGKRAVELHKSLGLPLLNESGKEYKSPPKDLDKAYVNVPGHKPLVRKILCPETGDEVAFQDIVSGYGNDKTGYIGFSKDEIKALGEEANAVVEMKKGSGACVSFDSVPIGAIRSTYYLGPDKSDRAYLCFARGLLETGLAWVGEWSKGGRKRPVVIVATGDENYPDMVMHVLYYSGEIRAFDNPCAHLDLSDDEVETTTQYLQAKSDGSEFDVKEFYDKYADRIATAAKEKEENGQISVTVAKATDSGGKDLMALLKADLAKDAKNDSPAKSKSKGEAAKKAAKKPAKSKKAVRKR
jgi:non-homologous end joining protein Ku